MAPGDVFAAGPYTLRFLGTSQERAANALELRARVEVSRGGDRLGVVATGRNRYFAEDQTSSEVGIRTDWLRAQDLFLIADQFNADGTVYLKAIVNPLVNLIWLGGLVFLLGSIVTMWPDAREQRRLASRFESQVAARAS